MKKLVFALSICLMCAVPALACDCDTASAIQHGYKDRLNRPFNEYNQPSQDKAKKPEVKAPGQQANPGQQAAPQQGGPKEEVR